LISADVISNWQPRGVFRISQWNLLKEMGPEVITHGKLFVLMKAISEETKYSKDLRSKQNVQDTDVSGWDLQDTIKASCGTKS
jgi:hypothetical protein